MSEPNQQEINEKLLNELATVRSDQNKMLKMFEDMMRSDRGKEPVPMDATSQHGQISSTQAERGSSSVGQGLSPGYPDFRGAFYGHNRMPPPPNLQFEHTCKIFFCRPRTR